jgi:hypothetical protein
MTESPGGPRMAVDDAAARRRAAAQIRDQRPGWIVIWAAPMGRYRAYPLFRAPRDTCLTAQTPEEMIAQMDQVEQVARRPGGGRPPRAGT